MNSFLRPNDNPEACAWVYAQFFFEQSINDIVRNAMHTIDTRHLTKENAKYLFFNGWYEINKLFGFLGSLLDLRKLFFNRAYVKALAPNEMLEGSC